MTPPVGRAYSCLTPVRVRMDTFVRLFKGHSSHLRAYRRAHTLELAREGVPLNIIEWQLGHAKSARPRSTCRG
jgi:hypothetical protein